MQYRFAVIFLDTQYEHKLNEKFDYLKAFVYIDSKGHETFIFEADIHAYALRFLTNHLFITFTLKLNRKETNYRIFLVSKTRHDP